MIKFECETCFQEYQVRDDRAGQVLKCKSCGHKMRVPAGEEEPLDDMYEEVATPTRPARKKKTSGSASSKKKKSSAKSNNSIGIIIGICVFAVAFYAAYSLVGGLLGNNKTAQQKTEDINQELNQLKAEMIEQADSVKKATTKEEKQRKLEIFKTTLARIKELEGEQKSVIAENAAKSSGQTTNGAAGQTWSSLVDPPGFTANWPESSQISIDLEGMVKELIIPYSFSPFIGLRHEGSDVLAIDVWNLAAGKKVSQVTMNIKQNWYVTQIKLSTDGKYLLLAIKNRDTNMPMLASWDVITGKKLAEWEVDAANTNIFSFDICNSMHAYTKTELRAGANTKSFLKRWDLKTGKLLNEKQIDIFKYDNSHNKISPGGKYLATLGTELGSVDKYLVVYDLESLEPIRLIPFLDFLQLKDKYFTLLEMEFSPDGKEIAFLLSNSNGTSIWILDLKTGKGSNGYQAPTNLSNVINEPIYRGKKLVWDPSGNGWLLYGAWYLDRQRKQVLWTLKPVPNVIMRDEIYLTPHYLLARTATALSDANGRLLLDRKSFLVSVEIPETAVTESLNAYGSQNDAMIGKGQQVSIEVNIGDVKFGNVDEVKSIIEDVIQQRLEAEGFKVAPDQPVVLKLEYHEQDGNKLKLMKPGSPTPENPSGRTATGKTLQATGAAFKITWIDTQTQQTLWSKEAAVNPRFLNLQNATAEAARKQMFEALQSRLMAESIPYFIPKDKNLSILPLEIALPE
tara:strand:+ start:48787 stop:51003 length:2217 start_codon:yes stop_codon:yes gene_type:complete